MAIQYRTAFCEKCDSETKQWKPSHRTLWNCDTCNSSNLDESGRYNCFTFLGECVKCDAFLSCLGRLDENLFERITLFREERERMDRQDVYVLDTGQQTTDGSPSWKAIQGNGAAVSSGTGNCRCSDGSLIGSGAELKEQEKVQTWLYAETEEGPELFLFKLIPSRGAYWQPVTGRVDAADPSLPGAVVRELQEETGLTVRENDAVPLDHGYSYVNEQRCIRYHEQAYAVKLPADFEPVISDEHTEWGRFTPDEAREVIPWPEQRAALERLLSTLSQSKQPDENESVTSEGVQ